MSLHISIKGDMKAAHKHLGKYFGKQVPFATSLAMNKTVKDIQKVEQAAIKRELDNPTPSTVKGIRCNWSNKRNLKASVFIINHIDKFLKYQIEGGTRPPRSKVEAVPVEIRLNKYGNIPGRRQGKIQKLLNKRDTFSGTINGVAGIWQRGRGRAARHKVKLLVAYESVTRYRPRFKFYDHAERTANKRWPRNFNSALTRAVKSAL